MQKSIVIKNEIGLHARPATIFIQEANKFKSEIFLIKGTSKINAKSIMGLMGSRFSKGTELILEANGPDEEKALDTLIDLINKKL